MDTSLSLRGAQTALAMRELRESNELSARFGLTLSESQMALLVRGRMVALERTGRVEFGGGVMKKLIYAFCDSPFIQRDAYAETLFALQDDFYELKNEAEDMVTDDELIDAMKVMFDGRAQGSLEYLEGVGLGELMRARSAPDDESDD